VTEAIDRAEAKRSSEGRRGSKRFVRGSKERHTV